MNSDKVIRTERAFPYTPEQIFDVHARGELLAKWWGPKDFKNTFETFEFKSGGKWSFIMHAPNGENYPNENLFKEIIPNKKIVIEHVFAPKFILTINLIPKGDQTLVAWEQDFETVELANTLRSMCEPANEQNMDRLEDVLKSYNSNAI